MSRKRTRRDFLRHTVYAGTSLWMLSTTGCEAFRMTARPRRISPHEKLNIAGIGVGGQGHGDLKEFGEKCGQNIVALADVDHAQAANTFKLFPEAKRYWDFREMLDKQDKQIDAVVVATPDHTHAVAAMAAMRMGKHVYVEKPLTHDVYEARMLTQAARKYGVVTQMGNQGTADNALRTSVEIVRSGAIGPVREAHVWTNRPIWPQGIPYPPETPPVPSTLNWDLWLGTAPKRPYNPAYAPFKWRGWWDYGTGALGDMACHTANMAYMALRLGSPTSVEAESSNDMHGASWPTWSIITYQFPARGELPPVKLVWYDGGDNKPAKALDAIRKFIPGEELPSSGSVVVGDKGILYSAANYGEGFKLLPEKDFEGYTPPAPTLPRAPKGHYQEWVDACKGVGKPMSNFDYAGPLTETVLLGCVALRAGEKIIWDGPRMKVTNCPKANDHIRREYRKPWTL